MVWGFTSDNKISPFILGYCFFNLILLAWFYPVFLVILALFMVWLKCLYQWRRDRVRFDEDVNGEKGWKSS